MFNFSATFCFVLQRRLNFEWKVKYKNCKRVKTITTVALFQLKKAFRSHTHACCTDAPSPPCTDSITRTVQWQLIQSSKHTVLRVKICKKKETESNKDNTNKKEKCLKHEVISLVCCCTCFCIGTLTSFNADHLQVCAGGGDRAGRAQLQEETCSGLFLSPETTEPETALVSSPEWSEIRIHSQVIWPGICLRGLFSRHSKWGQTQIWLRRQQAENLRIKRRKSEYLKWNNVFLL